ncbi:MAG: cache domain-containing protein, partial [Desulfobacteraceae bacterium]|nr:cache domain-containing protein [Desulfobacteraceae bacterium]
MKNKNATISGMSLKNMVFISLVSVGLFCLLFIYDEYTDFLDQSASLREEYVVSKKDKLRDHVTEVANYIQHMNNQTDERLKNSIRERVYESIQIADSIYQQNRASKSLDEIKKMIKDTLRPIRFNNGRGYYFAVSMDGVEQLYPVRPELEGKNLMDLQDSHGNFVIRDEINMIKKSKEGFITDFWPKPDKAPGVAYPKISFVKYFKPLDWYFGTGEYLDDVKMQIQEEVLNYIKDIRFHEDGYFFASTYHGEPLFSNGKITKGAQSIRDLTDPNGVKIFAEYQKAVENPDGGFIYYLWHKLNVATPSPKISFVLGIPDWEWIVGAGSYLDTIEAIILQNKAALKADLINNILKSLLILFSLLLLCLFWARHVSNKIQDGITSFSSFFKKAATDFVAINPDELDFSEFAEIATSANKMLNSRTHAEAALRESEEKYRLLFINSNDVIYSLDPEFKLLTVSPSVEKMLGYAPDELIGRSLPDINILESAYLEQAFLDTTRVLSGETIVSSMYAFTTKDGTRKFADVSGAPLYHDNKIIAMISIARDITERRQAEAAIQKSEQLLTSLFESIQDGISILNPDLTIRHVNSVMNQWYSKSLPLEGKRCYECYHNVDKPCNPCPSLRCLKSGKTEWNVVPGLAGSSTEWIELYSYPIKDAESGEITGVVEFVRDITARKRVEKEKGELESQLRQSRKMESIGTLSGGIAHDFNNILSIIIGNTELALDDVPEANSAHVNLEEIKNAGLRAKNIVSQLLAFSRKTEQNLKPVAIVPVIKDAIQFLRSTIPAFIDICADMVDAGQIVLGDPVGLNQVMMNLCINASHAMERSGGKLSINVASVILDNLSADGHSDLAPGDYVKITVSDTGPGINFEIMDRIFDPYFTTKDVGKGSGMGLAVVHGIVKNHGGLISVASEPGKGAVFTILLPRIAEQPKVKVETTMDLPTGSETILFVDDEASLMKLGQRMMERLGYKVDATLSPTDALERFRLSPDKYDLVITDMTMPQMT